MEYKGKEEKDLTGSYQALGFMLMILFMICIAAIPYLLLGMIAPKFTCRLSNFNKSISLFNSAPLNCNACDPRPQTIDSNFE